MSDALIRSALLTRLATLAGYPAAAYRADDGAFTPPDATTPWVRPTLFFGNETVRTLPSAGARLERTGFLQVDYFVPFDHTTATATLDALCQGTKDLFPAGQALTVDGRPLYFRESRRWGSRRDGGWLWDHVDIRWEYWAVNPALTE